MRAGLAAGPRQRPFPPCLQCRTREPEKGAGPGGPRRTRRPPHRIHAYRRMADWQLERGPRALRYFERKFDQVFQGLENEGPQAMRENLLTFSQISMRSEASAESAVVSPEFGVWPTLAACVRLRPQPSDVHASIALFGSALCLQQFGVRRSPTVHPEASVLAGLGASHGRCAAFLSAPRLGPAAWCGGGITARIAVLQGSSVS